MLIQTKIKRQNFLIDENVLNLEIKTANINHKDKIIEIGAGNGKLTKEIVKKQYYVLFFSETDLRFQEELDKIQSRIKI